MFLELDLGEGHTWLLTSPSPPPWRCETWCVNRPNKEEREKTLFVRLPATGEKKKKQAQPVACGGVMVSICWL